MERQDDEHDHDDQRKFSFSYDVCGEKLRLIDVYQEDDFLIDSPLFDSLEDLRLSAFGGTNEDEAIKLFKTLKFQSGNTTEENNMKLQNQQNLPSSSSSCSMEPARPSYLRKSLAWDSAFFNSAGVLDPDELAFLNKGLKEVEQQHICKGRTETKSSVHRSRKIDISKRSEIKSKEVVFQGHYAQRSEKTKMKDCQRKVPFWKCPKASERMKNLHGGTSLNENDAEIKDATKLGKHMMHSKKPALLNSCNLPSGCFSSPRTVPVGFSNITLSPCKKKTSLSGSSRKVPSAIARGKTEPRKSKLCASTSTFGTPARLLKDNKELGYIRPSILSRSIPSGGFSDIMLHNPTPRTKRKQQADELKFHLDTSVVQNAGLPNTPHTFQRKSSLSLQCEEMNVTVEMNTENIVSTSPVSTEPRKKFKPSGLRQPSPKLGFFDEEKAVSAKANEGFKFQHDTLTKTYGAIIDRKRLDKPFQDNTTTPAGTKALKHSLGSHILQSAPGIIKGRYPSSEKRLWNSSPRIVTSKSWSDVATRRVTRKFVGIEEGTCHKSRKVDAGECDRKRVRSQNSSLKGEVDKNQVKTQVKKRSGSSENKAQIDNTRNCKMGKKNRSSQMFPDDLKSMNDEQDKSRIQFNLEDQVTDLSKYFDIIDLNKDKDKKTYPAANGDSGIEEEEKKTPQNTTKSPFFDRKSIHIDDKKKGLPNISPNCSNQQISLFLSDNSLPSSRTPLADKTSICNQFKSPGESTNLGKLGKQSSSFFSCKSH